MLESAKPFLKWPGGKGRLIPQFEQLFPRTFTRYIEPFVGGGAVFLHIAQTRKIKESMICDANKDLIGAWFSVRDHALDLCVELKCLSDYYLSLTREKKQAFFYDVRERFNTIVGQSVWRSSKLIFLNKTCYNGLYRNNSKGKFNVPFGKYDKPSFYSSWNIEAVSKLLCKTSIVCGDFTECEKFVTKGTFVYMDPPYRPVSKTSNFTAFTKSGFTTVDQERLCGFFKRLDKRGAKLMLSNSDGFDGYFEGLYAGYNIHKVTAGRVINSKGDRRGKVSELVITNY